MSDNLFDDFEDDEFDELDPFEGVDSVDTGDTREPVRSLEDFEAEVDRNIKILMARRKMTPERRKEAAVWLGNSGVPRAITPLVQVYKKDNKNKNVQKAAAYALGQFKALDQAIERDPDEPVAEAMGRDENAYVVELLTNIALYDERGSTSRFSTRTMLIIQVLLIALFAVLAVLFLTSPEPQDSPQIAEADMTPAQRSLQTVEERWAAIRDDTAEIQRQVELRTSDGTPFNCEFEFAEPLPFELPSEQASDLPLLDNFVAQYNVLASQLAQVQTTYDGVCTSESATMTPETVDAMLGPIDVINQQMTDIETTLLIDTRAEVDQNARDVADEVATQNAIDNATAVFTEEPADNGSTEGGDDPATAIPTEIPATEVPTITPTLAISQVELNSHLGRLTALIDDAKGSRGHTTSLNQYWIDVRESGGTAGCTAPPPAIPDDYVLPDEVIEQVPRLQEAVEQVNVGLALSRLGWTVFLSSCQNGTIANMVEQGIQTTQTAQSAYDVAEIIVQELSGR